MKVPTLALAAVLALAATGPALATSHQTTFTGAAGRTATKTAATSCSGGSCQHQSTTTGSNGRQFQRTSSGTYGNGSATRTATVSGPYGRSRTHGGTTTYGMPPPQ